MYELVYTSAPQGLRPGATGYTVVAQTENIPGDLAAALEGLSAYRHRTVSADAGRADNPVAFGHYAVSVGYRTYHVLSRVADAGLDYSGRGNFLAHHVATTAGDLPAGGPAWVLGRRGVFRDSWDGPPRTLPPREPLPAGDSPPQACRQWERATGDAGWAGVLAAATDPARPAVVVYRPGQDVLGLLAEAIALLPPAERWQVTFATYYLGTPAGVRCQWRCVPADSPDLPRLLAAGAGEVIRVDGAAAEEPDGPLVEAARTGRVVQASARARPPDRPAVWSAPAAYAGPARDPYDGPAKPPAAAAPAPPRSRAAGPGLVARGSVDVKTLAAGLGLGVLLGIVLLLVFELATGWTALGPLQKAGRDDPGGEKRDGPRAGQVDSKAADAGPAAELERAKEQLGQWMRTAEDAKKEAQEADDRAKNLQQENGRQARRLGQLRDENTSLRAKLDDLAGAGRAHPDAGPKDPAGGPKGNFAVLNPSNVLSGLAILPKPESLFIQPIGVPHPAKVDNLSAPYTVRLKGQDLVRVEADGKAVKLKVPDIRGFPAIWCGLVAVTRQGDGDQPTRYYRAYKPPTVDLTRKPMANPPETKTVVIGGKAELLIKENGRPRWEFKLAEMVDDPAIPDLAHYIENGGHLALGRKARVKFSADLGGQQVVASHDLIAPAGAPADGPPTQLVDRHGVALEIDGGVLKVVAEMPALKARDLYCKVELLDVVRPLPELAELKLSGLTVFHIGPRK